MDENFCKLISVTMIIGMYVPGIVKYFKEALATVDNILTNQDVVEELQAPDSEDLQHESKMETKREKK